MLELGFLVRDYPHPQLDLTSRLALLQICLFNVCHKPEELQIDVKYEKEKKNLVSFLFGRWHLGN